MSIVNNSGDMSSSASPDEGTIPSKELRKRQVRELQKLDKISILEWCTLWEYQRK